MSLMIDAEGAYQPDTYNGTWPMTNPVSTIGGVNYTIIGEHGYYEPQVGVSMRYSVGHTVVGQYYCSYDERRINKSYFWGNMLMVNAPPGCP
jgi:hypothetical protein